MKHVETRVPGEASEDHHGCMLQWGGGRVLQSPCHRAHPQSALQVMGCGLKADTDAAEVKAEFATHPESIWAEKEHYIFPPWETH